MAAFVIDASVTMAWCFRDEASPYADAVLNSLSEFNAIAPGIWPLEVSNVLLVAERKNRISPTDSKQFLKLLSSLPISVENLTVQRLFESVLFLAREQNLSSYDAVYLDLALQNNLEIATSDQALRDAAAQKSVGIYLGEKIQQIQQP